MSEELTRELEARVIERAMFWNDYVNLLINLRHANFDSSNFGYYPEIARGELNSALENAVNAALKLQRYALAECFMAAGIGGERARAFAHDWAKEVLDEKALEFARKYNLIPTYWYRSMK